MINKVIFSISLCLLWLTSLLNAGEALQPNIVFILTDDQRNDTLGCAGHPIIKTPVIDRLAQEGVRFENAFVTTSICAASRASILTGLYERTHGYTFGKPAVSEVHMASSYPALLKAAGYRTGFFGKYGIQTKGSPEKSMFDKMKRINRSPYHKKQSDGSTRHESELIIDESTAFLAEQKKEQPFCLSISFNAVHAEDNDRKNQFHWPKAVDGLYRDIEIPLPRLNDPAIFEAHPPFLKKSMNRERFYWRWAPVEKYQQEMAGYFRMISGVDHVIGRLRNELEKQGFAENTVIIYTGDNGYYMGDRGFAGKWTHYEQSLRVPMIIYDPRLPAESRGRTSEKMVLNIDAPATMLDLAGIERPKHYQGHSLAPLMNGDEPPHWRKEFFCEHLMVHKKLPRWEGIRGERYVYARYLDEQPQYEFLHDLDVDPDQLLNLAGNADHQLILKEMSQQCDNLRKRYSPSDQ